MTGEMGTLVAYPGREPHLRGDAGADRAGVPACGPCRLRQPQHDRQRRRALAARVHLPVRQSGLRHPGAAADGGLGRPVRAHAAGRRGAVPGVRGLVGRHRADGAAVPGGAARRRPGRRPAAVLPSGPGGGRGAALPPLRRADRGRADVRAAAHRLRDGGDRHRARPWRRRSARRRRGRATSSPPTCAGAPISATASSPARASGCAGSAGYERRRSASASKAGSRRRSRWRISCSRARARRRSRPRIAACPPHPRLEAVRALLLGRERQLDALSAQVAATVADHNAFGATPAEGIARIAGFFDRAVAQSPEASVALYSLGDPAILAAATAEILEWLEEQGSAAAGGGRARSRLRLRPGRGGAGAALPLACWGSTSPPA